MTKPFLGQCPKIPIGKGAQSSFKIQKQACIVGHLSHPHVRSGQNKGFFFPRPLQVLVGKLQSSKRATQKFPLF